MKWIKTQDGNLINLENVYVLKCVNLENGKVIVKAYSGTITDNEGYIEFFDYDVAIFRNSDDAQKYVEKLAEKLGAEEF